MFNRRIEMIFVNPTDCNLKIIPHSILNFWQFKTTILSPPGSCRPLCCILNSNPCIISITQIINSSVPSADSLKHKTHPLRLAVAQRTPLLHRPPLLARFPARKQNFPAALGNIGLLGALTTWGKKQNNKKTGISDFFCVKTIKVSHYYTFLHAKTKINVSFFIYCCHS